MGWELWEKTVSICVTHFLHCEFTDNSFRSSKLPWILCICMASSTVKGAVVWYSWPLASIALHKGCPVHTLPPSCSFWCRCRFLWTIIAHPVPQMCSISARITSLGSLVFCQIQNVFHDEDTRVTFGVDGVALALSTETLHRGVCPSLLLTNNLVRLQKPRAPAPHGTTLSEPH